MPAYNDFSFGAYLWELTHPGQVAGENVSGSGGDYQIFDDGSTLATDAAGNAILTTDATDRAPDLSTIQRVMSAGQSFTAIYNSFIAVDIASVPPDMQAAWQATAAEATTVKTQLDNAATYASNAWGYVKGQFGLQGAREMGMGALGLVPLVVWGVLATALVVLGDRMATLYADYQLALQGKPRLGGGITQNIADSVKWAAVAAVAVFVLPKVLERK